MLSLLALLIPALAAAQWHENGRVIGDEPWRRADGEFGAMLLVTDRPGEFIEEWKRPAAPGYQPTIHTVSEASRGDVVAAMILFARCSGDALGNCRSTADFQVIRPDGTLYAEHKGVAVWEGPAPRAAALQLSLAHLAFEIEPEDPVGRYEIRAVVRDGVSRRSVTLLQRLEVQATPANQDR